MFLYEFAHGFAVWVRETVGVKRPVKMVELVLEDSGEPSMCVNFKFFIFQIDSLKDCGSTSL